MLVAILKIVQAALSFLPLLSPLPPSTSLGVKEIPKNRGSKVKVKVLNKIYTCKIPKTWKYANVISATVKTNKTASIIP
jgi:hypothetical protein